MTSVPAAPSASIGARDRFRIGTSERVVAGLLCLACASLLGVAAWLKPSEAGHGTHTQLRLPSCPWPQTVGGPCPTCGMTTAFAYAADGRFVDSFLAQPFGLLLALGTAAAFWAFLHIAATGSPAGRIYGKLRKPRFLWAAAGLALASWGYKWVTWR